MASIRKVRDKWQAVIRKQGFPTVSKSFVSKATAQQWAKQQEVKIEATGVVIDFTAARSTTVRQILERYEREVVPRKRATTTEAYMVRSLCKASFASIAILQLTTNDLLKYQRERLRSVSPATFNRQLTVLRHAINVAIKEWGYPLTCNPVTNLPKPKAAAGRTRRLTDGELCTLLSSIDKRSSPALAIIIQLAVETGMRRGELLELRWENISLKEAVAYLPLTKNGESRRVPLSSRAIALFELLDSSQSGTVFNLSANAFKLSWQRLLKRTGITDLHFHDLRHEAISRFFELGLTLPEVALISGHKDYKMLLRYTHLKAEDVAKKLG